jgi:hypothetical protein
MGINGLIFQIIIYHNIGIVKILSKLYLVAPLKLKVSYYGVCLDKRSKFGKIVTVLDHSDEVIN